MPYKLNEKGNKKTLPNFAPLNKLFAFYNIKRHTQTGSMTARNNTFKKVGFSIKKKPSSLIRLSRR